MERKSNINEFVVAYLTCWTDAMKSFGDAERKKLYRSGSYEGEDDCKGWTDFHLKKILYPLAEKMGYKTASDKGNRSRTRDYYRIDYALYNEQIPYHWGLDYAVEHENTAFRLTEDGKSVLRGGWLNEFVKLLPLNCSKARVIIGYDSFGENDWENKREYLLGVLANRAVRETLVEKPILLILAPSCEFIDKEQDKDNLFFRIKLFTKVQNGWEVGNIDELLVGNTAFRNIRDEVCDIFSKVRKD